MTQTYDQRLREHYGDRVDTRPFLLLRLAGAVHRWTYMKAVAEAGCAHCPTPCDSAKPWPCIRLEDGVDVEAYHAYWERVR